VTPKPKTVRRSAASRQEGRTSDDDFRSLERALEGQASELQDLRRRQKAFERRADSSDGQVPRLQGRIRALEQELASAHEARDWLQSALEAEQQARELARRASYLELLARIAVATSEAVPHDATVLVVSKGDDRLLELGGPRSWHFPQNERGVYAGYHPVDSEARSQQREARP
jgi:predicted RNase H-like nuclease (RuvC/YqgF family)